MRRYEFWCGNCGKKYFKAKIDMNTCNNPNCEDRILQLCGTVELAELPPGALGMDVFITSRRPLDTKTKT